MRVATLPLIGALGTDLLVSSRRRRTLVVVRPFVFAAVTWIALSRQWWPVVVVSVVALFLSVVVSAHDLVHASLGFERRTNDVLLCLIGMLVLESGHAYRASHLQHHSRYPRDDDPEGLPAHGTYASALLAGPLFLFCLFAWAWRRRRARWLVVEGCWFLAVVGLAVALWPQSRLLGYYVIAMVVASWSYPLMTVKAVHDPTADSPLHQTRTVRGRVLPRMFLELSYHLEHHLYPSVPSHRYAELSARLQPVLDANDVRPIRVP